ncbi:MAG: hypothetical protein RL684_915 [Pseudomonadota bacterium]|jgi:putative protein-disulfide isomerase
MATLHYIYDPYCGWCYAASPLVAAARAIPGLALVLHGGGMLAGTRRRLVTPQWREFVMAHDLRIAQMTGQPFGEAYFQGLLREDGALFDSAPPTVAIRAAEFMGRRGADMLARLQAAHFVEGRRISDATVLREVAVGLGLRAADFEQACRAYSGVALDQHYRDSQRLLSQSGAQGFPTFVFEDAGGYARLEHSACLAQPEAWSQLLAQRLTAAVPAVPAPHAGRAPPPPG